MSNTTTRKVALITGAAKRIGRQIALDLHAQNIDIAIHYRDSKKAAIALNKALNQKRPNSAAVFGANLLAKPASQQLIIATIAHFKRLDFLVNNASIFYPTPILQADEMQLQQFVEVNSLQPANLIRQAAPYLKQNGGSVVNILDIYADSGLIEHAFYVASKDLLSQFTKHFARSLAPEIRVNAVSPGAILWPDQSLELERNPKPEQNLNNASKQTKIIEDTALKKTGKTEDISRAVSFLLLDAPYTTGATINVDGGRSLYL